MVVQYPFSAFALLAASMVWHWTTAFCVFILLSAPVYTTIPGNRPGIMSLPKLSDTIRPRAGPTRLRISFCSHCTGLWCFIRLKDGSRLTPAWSVLSPALYLYRVLCPSHYTPAGTALKSYFTTAIPCMKESRYSPRYLMIKSGLFNSRRLPP
jgi:hypothetical protein